MPIRAYSGYSLYRSRKTLGNLFELALCQEKMDVKDFEQIFKSSVYIEAFGKGFPKYNGGMSSQDLLSRVLGKDIARVIPVMFGREYWAGQAIAYVQWYFDVPFAKLFSVVDLPNLLLMYVPYHEMDIMKLVEVYDRLLHPEPTLVRLRRRIGLSQSQLAFLTDLSPRTVRAYEHGEIELSNAKGETLYNMSRILGCSMEDLLH